MSVEQATTNVGYAPVSAASEPGSLGGQPACGDVSDRADAAISIEAIDQTVLAALAPVRTACGSGRVIEDSSIEAIDQTVLAALAPVRTACGSGRVIEDSSIEALDQTVLAALAEAQEVGEPDLIVELIDLYLEDAPQWVEAIRAAVAQADAASIKRAAHTLKGSSGSVGVCQVAEICKLFEQTDFDSLAARGETLMQLLDREFERARAALLTERDRRIS